MSVIGLRVGLFEIVEPVWVPEPGRWFRARPCADDEPPGQPLAEPDSGQDVLIRLLSTAANLDERALVRHQYEVLRQVDDERLPKAVRLDEGSGSLVVRALVGAPLADAIALRRDETVVMTPATLLDLVLEVSAALLTAHRAGLVHGHLDPDCVVLDPEGRVMVYGLGVLGAPQDQWITPEQSSGEQPTALSDQWALGALAIGLVLGHGVWQDDVLIQAVDDLARAVRAVADQWPALGRVLGRMVDPVPSGRFPSLQEARQELLGLARLAGTHSDRREMGHLLCTRRKLRPPERLLAGSGAPTAVPTTDAASDPSDGTWFARRPSEVPSQLDPSRRLAGGLLEDPLTPSGMGRGLLGRSSVALTPPPGPTVLPHDELSLGSDRPPLVRNTLLGRGADALIVKLAPVFAGIMVILLVVWVLVNLW